MVKAAAIQMVSVADVDSNLEAAGRLIREAADKGAELLVLPENFPFMGMQEQDKLGIREEFANGPIQQFLANQARTHGVWLIGGTIPLTASVPDRIRAASLLYDPAGKCCARYDKIHLFDVAVEERDEVYNESSTIEGGDSLVVARTPFGNIGMSVCYDLRFPELYRSMLARDVNIITVPSAFTWTTGNAHWESLLRARAVENLCYVIASNQGGKHINNRETWGHSLVMNPWGDVLSVVEEGEGVAIADIDIRQLEILREKFPTLKHRKPDYNIL